MKKLWGDKCAKCGCREFDNLYENGRSLVTCLVCLEQYELMDFDDEDE